MSEVDQWRHQRDADPCRLQPSKQTSTENIGMCVTRYYRASVADQKLAASVRHDAPVNHNLFKFLGFDLGQ